MASEHVRQLARLRRLAYGGRSGIRTHERVAPLTVFKTVAFVRSAILPTRSLSGAQASLGLDDVA
jgi:hypothetical protein